MRIEVILAWDAGRQEKKISELRRAYRVEMARQVAWYTTELQHRRAAA